MQPAARRVLVTGGSGFIGRHLVKALRARGDAVTVLSRRPEQARRLLRGDVDVVSRLDEIPSSARIDAIVNLAGAPILGPPWTEARRRVLRESRLRTTAALVALCARLEQRPAVLATASAIGYYGIGDSAADETTPPQDIFQSRLCSDWEGEARRAEALGIRVAILRFGIVLGTDGGALPPLALSTRACLGAVLGSGRQALPWVHIEDALALILRCIDSDALPSPLNVVSPQATTQADFARALGEVLRRPVLLRIPAFVMRTLLGEMSQLLLDGRVVRPAAASAAGHAFRHGDLRQALANLLDSRRP